LFTVYCFVITWPDVVFWNWQSPYSSMSLPFHWR
jgi:hypothetical protein